MNRIPKCKKTVKSKLKSEKSKENKHKKCSFKRKHEKKNITINMMCVKWPLNISLLILCICTCEHYTIAL